MRGLVTAFGVDYDQWWALTKAALKTDLRSSTFVRGPQIRQSKAAAALIGQLIFYVIIGFFMAAFVALSGDLFVSGSIVLSYVMFMVGVATLLDHNTAMTSPDDYYILGFQPLTSRTYFAARLTNVLVYTSAMTTLFSLFPVAAFFFKWGIKVGLAAIVATYGSSLFMALGLVTVYAWLLRVVGAARIKRLLSYVQFMFSFVVYGGYFVLSRMFTRSAMAAFSLKKTAALLLLPPTWFASYLEVAAGRTSAFEIVPVVVSIAAVVAFIAIATGRLSLDYADRLGAIATAPTAVGAKPGGVTRSRRAVWFTRGEARAVAMLIRSQFKNDMKFRMSILAILPLTIVYLAMGISNQGAGMDPFTPSRPSQGQGLGLVTVAMLMFPAMLKMSLGRSDAFRASWIFFACPIDRTKLVRAAKNVLVVSFLLPYMLFVAAVLAYFTVNLWHLAVHLLVVGLISHLLLQLITLLDPELPFSKPMAKGRSSTRVFVVSAAVGFGAVFFPLAGPVIYASPARIVVTVVILVGISVLMERLTRVRVEAQAEKLEFEG
jgi:hypothetical protein